MTFNPSLSPSYVRSYFHYDPETGFLYKKFEDKPMQRVGHVVRGYVATTIGPKRYLVHRLIWLYLFGRWPIDQIDHINGDKQDNRIANLREATRKQNLANSKGRSSTGFKGVYAKRSKYNARITIDGCSHFLGSFRTPEEASLAYKRASIRAHGEYSVFISREQSCG